MVVDWIGRSVNRKEDERLLKGRAQFVGDLKRDHLLHAAFLRSPHAHARIRWIDTTVASRLPGVIGVWTAKETAGLGHIEPLAMLPECMWKQVNLKRKDWFQPPLAEGVVRFQGEPVAVVVAESRHVAEDAVQLIQVEFDVMASVTTIEGSMSDSSVRLYPGWSDNIQAEFWFEKGDWNDACRQADVLIEKTYRIARCTGVPMECRGVMAEYEHETNRLVVYSSTQVPHFVKENLVHALNLSPEQVRVVAPAVGGGFGVKGNVYPEELVISYLAYRLRQPVKWVEDRVEHMQAASHGRDQVHHITAAFRSDGTLLGISDQYYVDCGAYNLWETCVVYNTSAHLLGPYRCPAYRSHGACVVTNKAPSAPYRGAGRPEAVFAMERMLDEAAIVLGIDRMELRRRNLIQPEEMPYEAGILYRDGKPVVYDSGNFVLGFNTALASCQYEDFLRMQKDLREKGEYIGFGIACYVEGTGIGPFEGATARLSENGIIEVSTGAASQGQSHETAFAQICAQVFDIPLEQVDIREGDTALIDQGVGTFASRSAVVAGSAIYEACLQLKDRLTAMASKYLQVPCSEMTYRSGAFFSTLSPDLACSLADLARITRELREPAEVTYYFYPDTVTYAGGVHAAIVKVNPETGAVNILKYIVVHDAGVEINPKVVEGQLYGGLMQGLGGALFEQAVYDSQGRMAACTFKDYLLPNIYHLPPVQVVTLPAPSGRNRLGVKGTGEGGAICPPAVIANAVSDAFGCSDAQAREVPLTPQRVHDLARGLRQSLATMNRTSITK